MKWSKVLKKEAKHLPEIPIIIDASDEGTLQQLESLAASISDTVVQVEENERLKLHLAAVFCNNFVNHLYLLMEQYCKEEDLDFKLLIPLIKETANRLETDLPSQVQTGPAIRGDIETISKHLTLLEKHPELKKIYQLFSQSISDNEFNKR